MGIEDDHIAGIFSDWRTRALEKTRNPRRTPYIDTLNLDEVKIKPAIAALVADFTEEFENYTPEPSTREVDVYSPRFATAFNERFGASIPGSTEMLGIMSKRNIGDKFIDLEIGQLKALSNLFNKVSRIPLRRVVDIRDADLPRILSHPNDPITTLGLPVQRLVFTQFAFREPSKIK